MGGLRKNHKVRESIRGCLMVNTIFITTKHHVYHSEKSQYYFGYVIRLKAFPCKFQSVV